MSQTNRKLNWLTALFSRNRSQDSASTRTRFGVSFKLITAVVMILVGIAGVQILVSNQATERNLELESEHKLVGYYLTYQTKVEVESRSAESLALSIANRADVQGLYLNGDRDELYDLLSPLFTQWKDRQIVHLYIENPDGTVFLRVHDREKFGDDITYRGTANTALLEKRATSGVEIGPSRLGVRGVAPMYSSEGQFIGLTEVGVDFDEQFALDLKEKTGADFTMWVLYEAAKAPNLQPAEGVPASPIEELFFYAGTNPENLTVSPDVYRSVLETGKPVFQLVNENTSTPSTVYITPLLGYNDKVLGILQISASYIDHVEARNAALLSTLGVTVGLTVVGLLIIWLFASRVIIRPLNTLSQFASRQMTGEEGARVSVTSGDEFQKLAETFNALASSVEQERQTLERRVADRTKALATSTEVTRRLSTATNPRQLATDVVEQVRSAFQYYHAHIYFLDEASGDLVMAGGTGEAGATMLARGHRIPKGRGLVGRAAESNVPVLVPDVSQAEDWLPNPLLLDTKSEAAIPISSGNQLLGVLDVQQNVVNGLNEVDVELLQSLAAQVAISLQNARAFEESRAKAELESLVNTIGQKIQKTTSMEDTLQTAIREVGLALGAARVSANIARQQADDHNASQN
jgi:putative methionine-R-sulfoxide reductase with GAF domain